MKDSPEFSALKKRLAEVEEQLDHQNQAEKKLRESEQKYRQLYSMMRLMCDNVPDMIWAKDLDRKYIFANKAICENLLNADDTKEPVGKDDSFFIQKQKQAQPEVPEWHSFGDICTETDKAVIETRKSHRFDEYGNVKGKFLFLDVYKAPFFDEKGNLIGTVGYGRDVTKAKKLEKKREKAEEALNSYQKQIEAMIDSSTDLIFLKDSQFRYVIANRAHEQVFHLNINEIIGKTDFDFMPDNIAENFQKSDLAALKNGYASNEIEIGNRFYHVVKQRVLDSDRQDIGITAVIRDTTEIKRGKIEKNELEKKLRQSQKMEAIGTLAGGISHDFNNILTAILGYTEIALEEIDDESGVSDLLDEVYSAGIRARDLVKQILAFARQTEQELKPIRVDLIAKEALKLIRSTLPTTIEIVHYFKSKSLVMADPTQIHQIIMNLCANAAHAMEEEGGKLKVSIKDAVLGPQITDNYPELEPGFYLKIEIEDTGVGIDANIVDYIFEPYFTTKESGEGTGLGLAVVHGIVKSYFGEIIVTSQVGRGSLFKIYLPLIKSSGAEKRFDPMEILMGSEHVLYVDDEVAIARLGKKMLESLGYRVTTRTSSIEALELFKYRADIFDLVITDMTMPNMTGDRLASEIMKIRPDIPVIICTGYSKKFSDEEAIENGIKAFQMKPLIKKELAKTVRKVLDDSKLG